MIRPALILTRLPFAELLEDVQLLMNYDAEELKRQTACLQQMQGEGRRSAAYLQRYKERLEHAQTRYEFVTTLISRLQTYDFRYLVKAIEAAKEKAVKEEKPEQYAFALIFHPEEEPQIILY